jgi:hypothetical protein
MAGQSSSSYGTAQLLLGHDNVVRVSQTVGRGRFKLDDMNGITALKGLGHTKSRSESPKLKPVFFTEPSEPFKPLRKLEGSK